MKIARRRSLALKKSKFLEYYQMWGVVGKSAKMALACRRAVYDWMLADPKFNEAFDQARAEFVEKLEAEALRRAVTGVNKPIFYLGNKCGSVKEYSDSLLVFMLKANAPKKYRDNQKIEVTGEDGKPMQLQVVELTDAELAAIAARGSKGTPEPETS